MAVSMSRLRYHKLYQFVRLCNESGYSLSHVYPQRKSLSHTLCQMYSTSSPVKAKKWNQTGTKQHAHGFDKTQSPPRPHHLRDDLTSGSHSKDDKVSKEEEDPESDPETEDEEEPKRFSYRKLKSQKSGKGYLRPSRYMFREVEATGEEENLWERKNADINRKGKVNWYARQMLRLSQENKARLCKDNSIFSLSVNYMCFFCFFSFLSSMMSLETDVYGNLLTKDNFYQVDEALELLSSMKKDRLNPKIEVYNIFISAYAKTGQVKKAFKLFNDVSDMLTKFLMT